MQLKLNYVIKFVDDMDRAVSYYRDKLGLTLKSYSSEWSEFNTGETTLALHPATSLDPAGSAQLGFASENIDFDYPNMNAMGVIFTKSPKALHGVKLAEFVDSEGARCTLSGPA